MEGFGFFFSKSQRGKLTCGCKIVVYVLVLNGTWFVCKIKIFLLCVVFLTVQVKYTWKVLFGNGECIQAMLPNSWISTVNKELCVEFNL